MREYYRRNRAKGRAQALKYARSHKKEAVERVRLWRVKNKEKWLAQLRDRYARNRDAMREKGKKYYDKFKHNIKWHRRRARLESSDPEDCTNKINLLRLERFCRWCCSRLTPDSLTIDHVVPLNRGGRHIPDNLAASCRKCNFSRGDKMIHEWLPEQDFPSCYS